MAFFELQYFLRSVSQSKRNLKWIKDVDVRLETIKPLEENIGGTLFDINHSNIVWDMCPSAKETKAKINKWNLIKCKSFFHTKRLLTKLKEHLLNRRNYFQMMQLTRV